MTLVWPSTRDCFIIKQKSFKSPLIELNYRAGAIMCVELKLWVGRCRFRAFSIITSGPAEILFGSMTCNVSIVIEWSDVPNFEWDKNRPANLLVYF